MVQLACSLHTDHVIDGVCRPTRSHPRHLASRCGFSAIPHPPPPHPPTVCQVHAKSFAVSSRGL
eukprot:334467-Prymnesium_polylepis.1